MFNAFDKTRERCRSIYSPRLNSNWSVYNPKLTTDGTAYSPLLNTDWHVYSPRLNRNWCVSSPQFHGDWCVCSSRLNTGWSVQSSSDWRLSNTTTRTTLHFDCGSSFARNTTTNWIARIAVFTNRLLLARSFPLPWPWWPDAGTSRPSKDSRSLQSMLNQVGSPMWNCNSRPSDPWSRLTLLKIRNKVYLYLWVQAATFVTIKRNSAIETGFDCR